jgi:sn-glycerol 3-phosphate transport system substrate-binding protein
VRSLFRPLALCLTLAMLLVAGCGSSTRKEDSGSGSHPGQVVELKFYFPVAVGGPITKQIEAMVSDFHAANPNIKVTPVFGGNYTETMTKVQAAMQGGTPPEVAVLLATDIFTLTDMKAIVPLDEYIAADKDGKAYIDDFLPAFMANSKLDGKLWSIPFQRSTPILYYNKEAFQEAGLDPEKPPRTWDELVTYGQRLTRDGRWGVEIPSDGNPSWIFSAFFIQNGKNVVNEAGTEVSFNAPEVVEALAFIQSLAKTHKIMPPGVIKWSDVPNDFVTGKAAMIYHTTGSIGNIKAKMDPAKIGVAFLPAGKRYGAPTGGGNLYIFKTTKEKQEAAWKFVRFLTEPERVAQWSVDTGYIPTRKAAAETKVWKDAVAAFPGYGVAVEHLQYADREIASHQNQQVLKALGDQLQAVVSGTKPIQEAMDQAQRDAENILKPFKK